MPKKTSTSALPESLLRLLQGQKTKPIKLKPVPEEDKSDDDDIIFLIENSSETQKSQEKTKKLNNSFSNNFNFIEQFKHKNSPITFKSLVTNTPLSFNEAIKSRVAKQKIFTIKKPSAKSTIAPRSFTNPREFTPSANMESPNSFRPSTFYSPFFIAAQNRTPKQINIPEQKVTKNPKSFINRKLPPTFLRDGRELQTYYWLWPREEGLENPLRISRPGFHAL